MSLRSPRWRRGRVEPDLAGAFRVYPESPHRKRPGPGRFRPGPGVWWSQGELVGHHNPLYSLNEIFNPVSLPHILPTTNDRNMTDLTRRADSIARGCHGHSLRLWRRVSAAQSRPRTCPWVNRPPRWPAPRFESLDHRAPARSRVGRSAQRTWGCGTHHLQERIDIAGVGLRFRPTTPPWSGMARVLVQRRAGGANQLVPLRCEAPTIQR